jgi:hypothetical protein
MKHPKDMSREELLDLRMIPPLSELSRVLSSKELSDRGWDVDPIDVSFFDHFALGWSVYMTKAGEYVISRNGESAFNRGSRD